MRIKGLKFKVHFNRINMQRGDSRVWTVHTSRACYQVEQIKIYVPVETIFKPEASQPRAYFTGHADVYVHNKIAYLLDERSPERMTDDEYFEAING